MHVDRWGWVLVFVGSVDGCAVKSGADAPHGSSDTGGTESGNTDGGSVLPPCNRHESACASDDVPSFDCDSPPVCDSLVVRVPDDEVGGPVTFDNPEAATCILDALRNDVAATHRLSVRGEYTDSIRLEALGDGTVIWRSTSWEDECYDQIETWAQRRDDAFFEACLAADDDAAQYECLRDAFDPEQCVDAPAVCP